MVKDFGVTVHIDGGSRGNPGPAAAGVVVRADDDGTILHESGSFLGRATNNVAEYNGLLVGLQQALALGAKRARVYSDSQLMVRQINGQYRVKNAGLRPLYNKALQLSRQFESFSIDHVRREQNAEADKLVNDALNAKASVGDPPVEEPSSDSLF
ncbi:MAG: ribonuclease HI family protein [Planctomycetota bacterium]